MESISMIIRKAVAASSVLTLNPLTQPDDVVGIALVYQKAFGGDPWNEGYICPVCQAVFADESGLWGYCPHCQEDKGLLIKILRYWPLNKILTDFYQEMVRPGAICLAMKDGCSVIAFAWGYEVKVNFSLDKYLEAPNLHKLIKGTFMYLDECAVLPAWQKNGCGKSLLSAFIDKSREAGRNILLRTLRGQAMHKLALRQGGGIIQNISQDRVIIMITTQ